MHNFSQNEAQIKQQKKIKAMYKNSRESNQKRESNIKTTRDQVCSKPSKKKKKQFSVL